MSVEVVGILIFTPIIIFSIWMSWFLCKIDSENCENWDHIMNAPRFRIVPSYGLSYSIEEKELWPMPRHAPMMFYRPLWGYYKTREEAEMQIAHYMADGNVK